MSNKTICFDFDGVIHKYRQGYKDGSIYDKPNLQVIETMKKLLTSGYSVCICSTRDPFQICDWWNNNNFGIIARPIPLETKFWTSKDIIGVTNRKPIASVYIDDRGLCFNGNTESLYKQITEFKTYQEKEGKLF